MLQAPGAVLGQQQLTLSALEVPGAVSAASAQRVTVVPGTDQPFQHFQLS